MKEDILDRYATNQLSPEDEIWLKQELEKDPSFQNELDLYQDIVLGMEIHLETSSNNDELKQAIKQVDATLEEEGFFESISQEIVSEEELIETIRASGEKELKTTIESVDRELEEEGFFEPAKTTPIFSLLKISLAAASVLLMLTFGWQYMTNNNASNSVNTSIDKALLAHHKNVLTKKAALELTEMGFGGNPKEEQLKELISAMVFYDKLDYPTTILQLNTLLQKGVDDDYISPIQLYLAISYFHNDQIKEALVLLQELVKLNDHQNTQKETSIWYLALAQLKNKNTDLANAQLEQLKSSTIYGERALELLKD